MGQNHARILSRHPAVSRLVLCDANATVRAQVAERTRCRSYGTLNELFLAEPSLDFAVVAVPTFLHFQVAKPFVERGIHCLIEKPITAHLDEGRRLAELAAQLGVVISTGHVERFNPAVQALRQLTEQGALGEVKILSAKRVGPGPSIDRRGGIDVIVDLGIHELDLVRYLTHKSVCRLEAVGQIGIGGSSDDFAVLVLDLGDAVATIRVDWVSPTKSRELEVVGTTAMAHVEYMTQDLRIRRPQNVVPEDEFARFLLHYGTKIEGERISVISAEPLQVELDNFLHFISEGAGEIVTPDDALAALELAVAASRRIRQSHAP
ncbi:MAG: Gfo/Idh/MocA family oxidoreductase [Chloroflexi bacterium]|nr:Gfo/Idh/MocA family oxidoreductase [Chloroflexota bacterium]